MVYDTAWKSWGTRWKSRSFERVYQRFLEIADKKSVVDDRDLEAIVSGETWPFMFRDL